MQEYLNWRYATKKFDQSKIISEQEFAELLEVLRFSPSSYGLQPWKFVVVQNKDTRKKLKAHAWNQPQIMDASHLIVLCSLKTMDEEYIKNYLCKIAETRRVSPESLGEYKTKMLDSLRGQTPDLLSNWMKRQVYIALGMLLSHCAHKNIDACPMEGFDSKKFNELLGLDKYGVESVVLCAVGYRDKDDAYSILPKVRFKEEEIFINL